MGRLPEIFGKVCGTTLVACITVLAVIATIKAIIVICGL